MNENTYWNNKGKYQELSKKLNELVPASGPVENARGKNKALERFRVASNAYYDIFNNGGGNRDSSIRRIFNVSRDESRSLRVDVMRSVFEKTEPVMDEIILAAAKEQGIQ